MLSVSDQEDVLRKAAGASLLENGQLFGPERLEKEKACGIVAGLEGTAMVEERVVQLCVALKRSFPLALPKVLLRPWDALGFIPHVLAKTGEVCYASSEEVALDWRNPVGIVCEALERSVVVLAEGVTGANRWDFVHEFDAHWRQIQGAESLASFVRPTDRTKRVTVLDAGDGGKFVCDGERAVREYLNGSGIKPHTALNAVYIPLEEGAFVKPPRPDEAWSPNRARAVIREHASPQNLKALRKIVKGPKHEEVVVIRLPRPGGTPALFGLRFKGTKKKHPVLPDGEAGEAVPIALNRRDREYLVPRGGGCASLNDKRVALVGCGSVGGHIAFELARSGILNLTLIDPDVLAHQNGFRHVLGRNFYGKKKPEALKEAIEGSLPYVKVDGIAKPVESALEDGDCDLRRYDLVVVAVGKPAAELYLNEKLQDPKMPAGLFTWLDPHGIGGHAILVQGNGPGGCLECLYTPVSAGSHGAMRNRASFASPGQSFGKDLLGCGSRYTPYGSIDAVRTAELATRLGVRHLQGRVAGSPVASWKGDADEFLEEGYELSNRYDQDESTLRARRYDYTNENCTVCGGVKE